MISEFGVFVRLMALILALAALVSLAGCLPCQIAGATRCVGGYAVQACDGRQWQDALDCTTTMPPTVCVQPDAGVAYCSRVAP